jgi:5-methylcytosine-specific restriction enzyme subunit McrC
MSHLAVSEWGRVPVVDCPGDAGFTRSQANALIEAAHAHPLGGDHGATILRDHYRYLSAGQMVGVIAAPGCSLEILPKIDMVEPDPALGRRTVRQRLVRMLDVALGLDIGSGSASSMATQAESLLDILIRLFADRLLSETRRGLPRAYFEHEDDLPVLRGRLNVQRQFTAHAVRPDRLACRFDALSSDLPLLQVMKACVLAIRRHARAADTIRKLDELRYVLSDISDVPVALLPWNKVRIDRTNQRWGALFNLARLFLKRDWQATHRNPAAGEGITLLFPMNDLFESYVAVLLRRSLRPAGLTVETQGGRLFCLTEEGDFGRSRFQTRPDILVRDDRSGELAAIADTKWKRISPAVEDSKHGVSQSDVYQMIAYARLYGCRDLMLLYPHHAGLGDGRLASDYVINSSSDRLHLRTVDLALNEPDIVANLAEMVCEMRGELPVALE